MEHLEIIKDAIFLIAIGCGVPMWIITVIKKGQKESVEQFATEVKAIRKDIKKDRKKIEAKVSKEECLHFRQEHSCGTDINQRKRI